MQRITSLKTDGQVSNADELVHQWKHFLQEQDHSPGTVKKYTQAVIHFLAWYDRESGYFEKPAHVIRNSVFHLRGDHSIHWGDKLLAWDREHCSGETIKAICPFRQELGFSPAMDGVVSFQTSESRFGRVSK
jgi:hypothetical protein